MKISLNRKSAPHRAVFLWRWFVPVEKSGTYLRCACAAPYPSNKQAANKAGRWLLSTALLLTPPMVSAQVEATSDYLARMDSNRDGRVSLAEYQAWMGYAFEQMDRNRDDVLSPDELPGGRGRPVTLAEHRQTLAEAFRRQDRNRDGFLDARELAAPPQ